VKLTHPSLPGQPIDVPDSTGETLEREAGWKRADFDPAAHTVEQVREYLSTADEAETQRVVDTESAGQARVGIVGHPDDE
jgi:uncharacterized protein YprB with RNaseH-like and TPR domain